MGLIQPLRFLETRQGDVNIILIRDEAGARFLETLALLSPAAILFIE